MSKRKGPDAKGEQANRAEKEKFLNGQFQFKQFFASGQWVVKKFFISRARAIVCVKMRVEVKEKIEMR